MKIHYITQHGVAEWTEIYREEPDVITLSFSPSCVGAITLRGKVYAVNGGQVNIPTRALANGEYRPVLESDTGRYALEGFIKDGDNVSMLKTEESTIRRLLKACRELKESRDDLVERVERLEDLCTGHNIFSYERKK